MIEFTVTTNHTINGSKCRGWQKCQKQTITGNGNCQTNMITGTVARGATNRFGGKPEPFKKYEPAQAKPGRVFSQRCASKLKRKVERPNKQELKKMVWEIPTVQIAKQFGVSDNAVAKWCKIYKIDKPPRGYWS